jgi:hypothetical protein
MATMNRAFAWDRGRFQTFVRKETQEASWLGSQQESERRLAGVSTGADDDQWLVHPPGSLLRACGPLPSDPGERRHRGMPRGRNPPPR